MKNRNYCVSNDDDDRTRTSRYYSPILIIDTINSTPANNVNVQRILRCDDDFNG
jgi:hypothetical protein